MNSTLAIALLFSAVTSGAPKAPQPSLKTELESRFTTSIEKAKATLTCDTSWKETAGQAPTGSKYTVLQCVGSVNQMVVRGAQVFAMGHSLIAKTDERRASATYKLGIEELKASGCKALNPKGQMMLFECSNNFTVALLSNWDSKDNTRSESALYGQSDQLLAMIGAR